MRRSLRASLWLLGAAGFAFLFGPHPSEGQPTAKPAPKASINAATPLDRIKIKDGFKVQLLYSVPKETQGSWVSMCPGPNNTLFVCDQYGKLYRVTPKSDDVTVEPIPVEIGHAQGLLWAFDSLYVSVNSFGPFKSGLYRVIDSNDDGKLDTVKLLRLLEGKSEHGPHALLLTPDKKSIVIMCGNHTNPTEFDTHRVQPVWDEDQLLPRMWDAKGHARGRLAPGGWAARVDPDGETWELLTIGYRNAYDAAFNREGDLFTYDSDMEWDFNTPWYRPTRVCFAASGSDFGWRSGTGKFPVYYPDTLPPVVDIGPGSPTGVTFGYGAKFPHKYQEALYCCDWSYGKLYAVHLKRDGAGYTGEAEEFMYGTPLPMTAIVVHPDDGAMYFTIGGRKAQSGLYRITHVGADTSEGEEPEAVDLTMLAKRRRLELFHGQQNPKAVETAWPHLKSPDRFLRHAARIAIESQPISQWRELALSESDSQAAIEALLALVRHGDKALQPRVLRALERIEYDTLTYEQQLALIRVYGLTFIRLGEPDDAVRERVIARFDPQYPGAGKELNAELSKLLVYVQAPSAAEKTMNLMRDALTQEEQMDYALALRELKTGWTPELRKEYFEWFVKAGGFKGGASFDGFVKNIKAEAVAHLSPEDRKTLKPILEAKPQETAPAVAPPRDFVKKWTLEELTPIVANGLKERDYENGRKMFAATRCFACHRYGNEGGSTGPDLTGVAGRFNTRDLLESILLPSKEVSDQYQAVVIETDDGRLLVGRIVNIFGDEIGLNTDAYNPGELLKINRDSILSMAPSEKSMMPEGLLDTLHEEEILDLMAYLLSRADRNHPMFKK